MTQLQSELVNAVNDEPVLSVVAIQNIEADAIMEPGQGIQSTETMMEDPMTDSDGMASDINTVLFGVFLTIFILISIIILTAYIRRQYIEPKLNWKKSTEMVIKDIKHDKENQTEGDGMNTKAIQNTIEEYSDSKSDEIYDTVPEQVTPGSVMTPNGSQKPKKILTETQMIVVDDQDRKSDSDGIYDTNADNEEDIVTSTSFQTTQSPTADSPGIETNIGQV